MRIRIMRLRDDALRSVVEREASRSDLDLAAAALDQRDKGVAV
jgi:hypothetical protein